ncbi:MAG: YihY family inner membrane protein [Hydrogenovibrio sp.]|uniref:YihY family inner membrane protein n=1 Tax=Hydrogenovibrio sp. TaxID=2065821 RepID=UPI0028705AE3|nr:YihY family inner membrane protein [Hydrogenovibrio sp.]MDR9500133.1 YihY family inner membrane protein [Hydrogenovibrio sp.]
MKRFFLLRLIRLSGYHFWKQDGTDSAMVLAFTTLLGMVPLLALLLTVFSATEQFQRMSEHWVEALVHWLTPSAIPMIETHLTDFSEQASNLTGISAWLMVLTSLLLLTQIDQKINRMWRNRRSRRWWVSLLHYFGLSFAGPVILALGVTLQSWLATSGPGDQWAQLAQWLPLSLYLLGLTLLYRFVPTAKVHWLDALSGALVATLLLVALNIGFEWYVTEFAAYNLIYGAFAAIPFFLVWLYGLWAVILFGAAWVRTLGRLKSPGRRQFEDTPTNSPTLG